jgi:hypothetical protein
MKLRLLLIGLVAFTAACTKSTTEPSPAAPNTFTFSATLLPANETPPISNSEAGGKGTATITLIVTKDSGGTITAATVTFAVSLNSFPPGTNLTAAHIHEGASGVAGAIKVQTSLSSGEVVLTDGTGGFNKTFAAPADIAQAMINNPAGYYFNVHTTLNPGGVARGQLNKN